MKHRILLIGLGFVWACSGDPNQQGNQDRNPRNGQVPDTADSIRDINVGGEREPAKNQAEPIVATVNVSEGDDVNGEQQTSGQGGNGQVNPELENQAKGNQPGKGNDPEKAVVTVPTEPLDTEEGSVTAPHKITGAYLVGVILPSAEQGPVRVGMVLTVGSSRPSLEPARYQSTWNIANLAEGGPGLKLTKSYDQKFDKVLEFKGTMEEFALISDSIAVEVNVVETSEGGSDSSLSSLVVNTLTELLTP